ncbi:2-polyprenyl-6-methoxyphenol hydroxylase-like FAD-dependent oxidoreductase [Actinoplanes octamycinicus]|uniref:2-polyprenyl-6-methoxyphenol hydroxylase-like FAD-dependent oxidoreductase n=1 Tax=Actinoplanes octamycinicus TaxID=135948 RepID=A0A7W7M8V0_9ACTN|nr:FAD-dependent monooxygenase [Actinoplanes octamycinicus]MBB4741195.1 2-polyprenyl-6-methoxyphenol hydroxylase-like FAD-dependent oxidoreductase [Actinoplanes octamycinicus]GIE56101.1 hydroxylase [Actinoplanes octamycinicus]
MSAASRFAAITTSEPPAGTRVLFRTAVVLGGSVAGLMAARVLSDHADHVLIVERDDLAALDVSDEQLAADPVGATGPRPGVPQGSQVHALLPSGQRQLERFFPGFGQQALDAGAVDPPPGTNRFYMDGELRDDPPTGPAAQALISSRPFLEALIRNRVLALPNVRAVHGRAEGLRIENGAVTGVRVDGAEQDADFVVDATGRSSRLSDWLEADGFPRPPMQRMGIKLNYATQLFQRPADAPVWTCISIANPGPGKVARIGGFTPIEGDRWTMLVSGYADDKPGRDADEYRERCVRDFPAEFGRVATGSAAAGEVVTYHQADSRRRDFHVLRRFPARLVAAGDAVASFNPVYGQGMTSAMLHASCLSEYLRGAPALDRPALSYFADVKVVVDAAWQVSTMADLALPHVDGPYPRGYKMIQRISGLIFKASMRDRRINLRLGEVTTMLAHPSALTSPGFLLRAVAIGARA